MSSHISTSPDAMKGTPHENAAIYAQDSNASVLPTTNLSYFPVPQPQENQTPSGKTPQSKRKREFEHLNPEPQQTQQEETLKLSSTDLTDDSVSESAESLSFRWLLKMVNHWREKELERTSRTRLPKFYGSRFYGSIISFIQKDPCLVIKKNLKTSPQKRLSKTIISTKKVYPLRFSITSRNEEQWSKIENFFLKIMAFDPEHHRTIKDLKEEDLKNNTLRKIAITLNRSESDCLSEWKELCQKSHSSNEKTIQPSLFEANSEEFREWVTAMIPLCIKKLKQIDLQQGKETHTLWYYCYAIINRFAAEPRFQEQFKQHPKLCSVSSIARKIMTIFSEEQQGKQVSSFEDRSEENWHFIEKKFLEFMLSYCENTKETLRTVLAILGCAPVDVELTPEYLQDLKVQIQNSGQVQNPELLQLNTRLCERFDSVNSVDSENVRRDDDNPPKSQNSTARNSIESFGYNQSASPIRGLSHQAFVQEPGTADEDMMWCEDLRPVHRHDFSAPEKLFPTDFPPPPSTDMNDFVDKEFSSILFSEPDEESFLSPLFGDLLPPATTSTRSFSSTANQTMTPPSQNEEMPAKRKCSSPDDPFDQAGLIAQGSLEEPLFTEFTAEEAEKTWKEVLELIQSGKFPLV